MILFFRNKETFGAFLLGLFSFGIPYAFLADRMGWEVFPMMLLVAAVGGLLLILAAREYDKHIINGKINKATQEYNKASMHATVEAGKKFSIKGLDGSALDKQLDLYSDEYTRLINPEVSHIIKQFKLNEAEWSQVQLRVLRGSKK